MRWQPLLLPAPVFLVVIAQVGVSAARAQLLNRKLEDIEFFSLVLIAVDVERAATTMNLLDENGDGRLEATGTTSIRMSAPACATTPLHRKGA